MKKYLAALALASAGMVSGGMAFAQQDASITIAAGAVGQELQLARAAAQRYMDANPHTIGGQDYNVTINVLETIDSSTDRLALYLQFFEAQSAEVDVYQVDVIWPGDLAENLISLNDYVPQEVLDQHFPAIVENNTVDGNLVALPWFTDGGLLYYRTDLLEKYNFDGPPETWTELEEMATTIMEGEQANNPDFTGFVWQGNAYEGLTCDALEWIASSSGGSIISPEGTITVYNDNAVEIVDRAAGWVGTISPNGVTGFDEEGARNVFQAGNAAFMRNWPYAYSLGNSEDSAVAGNFDVAPLPTGDGGTAVATLGGWQLAVSRYSKNPAVAADVALFLASPEEQKTRAINGSYAPTIPALYEDPEVLEAQPVFESLGAVLDTAVARPSTISAPQYNAVSQAFFNAVHSVLTGQDDAENALATLELDLEDLTGFPTGDPNDASSSR